MAEFTGDLLEHPALDRLRRVAFLGGLSPRYRQRDGVESSRYDHSVAVAALAVQLCQRLRLSVATQRLAACWGLLHDVATFALSHTSEPAFSRLTRLHSSRLREQILRSDPSLPGHLGVGRTLSAMGVSVDALAALFHKHEAPQDQEHVLLWRVLRSPFSPDALDGIHRASVTYGDRPSYEPQRVIESFERDLFDELVVQRRSLGQASSFWKAKAALYESRINHPGEVAWESRWSSAIFGAFRSRRVNVESLLALDDETLVADVPPPSPEGEAIALQLEFEWSGPLFRYKAPLRYVLLHEGLDQTPKPDFLSLQGLSRYFVKMKIREPWCDG
ncbi:MAG: HD domain-containing protein [Sandaracinus sp.]|nr:HD domain-containing protein [Sandaracinus sp.]MCB9614475.1 HD domain-containing protein [Sandaracinus sp.]